MTSPFDRNIRDGDGTILAQWIADGLGHVGPVGRCPATGVVIVYTSGARGVFFSRGGTHSLTITSVGADVSTVVTEHAEDLTHNQFVARSLSQYLASERAAADQRRLDRLSQQYKINEYTEEKK